MIRAALAPSESVRAPKWARPDRNVGAHSEAEALFFAVAALSALDAVVRSDPPWAGAWRARLAPKTAAAVAQNLLARREDESALRDAVAFAKSVQELGPAGRVCAAFRTLCGPGDPFRPERLAAVAADLMAPLDPDRAGELAAALREAGARPRPAPVVAAAAAEAVTALRVGAEPLALWVADAALARSLGWPVPVPLLASEALRRGSGESRRPRPGDAGWAKHVALTTTRAGLAVLDLAQASRAGRLGSRRPRRSCAPRRRTGRSRRCSPTTRSPPPRRSRA